jgi:pyruvate dehydrogenase phosphatase regulatory subunit
MSEPYVKVPLHACEHYYLHTKPVPGLDPMTPGKEVLNFYLDVS